MTGKRQQRQSDSHPSLFVIAPPNHEEVFARLALHGDFVVSDDVVGGLNADSSFGHALGEDHGQSVTFTRSDGVTIHLQWTSGGRSSGVIPALREHGPVTGDQEESSHQRPVSGIDAHVNVPVGSLVSIVEHMADHVAVVSMDGRIEAHVNAPVSSLESIVEHMADHVAVVSMDGRIEYVNAAFEAKTGKARGSLCSCHIGETWGAELDHEVTLNIRNALLRGEVFRCEMVNRNAKGELYFDEVVVSPLRNEQGIVTHCIAVGRDTTARNVSDPLTGLQSRWMLLERVRLAMERAKRYPEQRFALLFIDVDRFKAVNDTYGKDVGDGILRELGRRLQAAIRDVDAVGHTSHLYRDEFGVLLEHIRSSEDAESVAARLDACIRAPIATPTATVVVTASIGIALADRAGASPEEVIRDAETAMMRAKHGPGLRRQVFVPRLHDETTRKQQVSTELHRALRTDELKLYYQPIVELRTGAIRSAEALIRWLHPEKGMISPSDFVPAAEETGLIIPLGQRVLNDACRQMHAWQATHRLPVSVSVNVSARQFRDPDFVRVVEGALRDHSVDPTFLKLEVTESTAADDPDSVIRILRHLRGLGVQILLDDFGTGYSSLSYLTRLPLDKVKIDRSFIQHATEREHEAAVVSTIIAMGKSLGLALIAEGVETEAQLQFLRCRDCDEVQGFLFSRPLPAVEFATLLCERSSFEMPGSDPDTNSARAPST